MRWHAEWAWLGEQGIRPDVLLEVEDDRLTRVEPGVLSPPDATRLRGVTLPGLANVHSHAFHRALRARTHSGAGDFWAWRERVYAVAGRLDPELYQPLARACFAEMALSGITAVGEFHYLHQGPGGQPYEDPNAMAEALRSAAAEAGLRLTLLDTLYLRAGFGSPARSLDPVQRRFSDGDAGAGSLDPVQRRFSDGDAGAGSFDLVQRRFSDGDAECWTTRVEALTAAWAGDPLARVGAAIHSVRAVDVASMKTAAGFAADHGLPLHVHVSEQPAENTACRTAHGCTPVELLAQSGALGPRTTAVHATHVTEADLDLLAAGDVGVCLCPTTERDLADGVGPARAMAKRGIRLSFGSDSHAMVDPFEEARAAELDERLVSGRRDGLSAQTLFAGMTEHGYASLGWPEGGALAVGRLGDFTTIGLASVRLAGIRPADLAAGLVFSATAADVTDVVVGGRPVVRNREHLLVDDVPAALAAAIGDADDARGRPR